MSLKRLRPDDLRVGLKSQSMRGKRFKAGDLVVLDRPNRARARRRARAALRVPEEIKFFDTTVSFAFDNTAEVPATGQWTLIPQGDTQSTRDGRLAKIVSIHFRGAVVGPIASQAAPTTPLLYLWVVQDKQANGAAAAVTDVFTSTAAQSCMINLNNSKRFRILHKEVIDPATRGAAAYAASPTANVYFWPVEFYKKANIMVDWDSTAGAITEIKSNNIFIIAGSASGASLDDVWTLDGVARLRFIG